MANILVVDDSQSMRQMVKFSLQSAGHHTVEAPDGKSGLNAAKLKQFDLVVTDVNMPIMNGFELTKGLRALPNYKFTPVLMLTTESDSSKKAEGKAAGVTGWIVKPFQPEKLITVINKLI